MNINCPYDKLTIKIANITAASKLNDALENKENELKLAAAFSTIPDRAPTKPEIADFHQIPLEMLINSPNIELLVSQYYQAIATKVVNSLEEIAGLTNKEAWAVLYGIID